MFFYVKWTKHKLHKLQNFLTWLFSIDDLNFIMRRTSLDHRNCQDAMAKSPKRSILMLGVFWIGKSLAEKRSKEARYVIYIQPKLQIMDENSITSYFFLTGWFHYFCSTLYVDQRVFQIIEVFNIQRIRSKHCC